MMNDLTVLDLFSGIGGFSLGLERAGMRTVAFCEIEDYPRAVLKKNWPNIHRFSDVKKLNAVELLKHGVKSVDVICGGFPCQDISSAGFQGGINGERSGLYAEMLRIISDIKPKYAIFENVTALIRGNGGRWFSQFINELAALGFDAEWHCIAASQFGAAHHRDRIWIIAYPTGSVISSSIIQESICSYSEKSRRWQHTRAVDACLPADDYARMRPNFNDVSEQMGQLRAYGNSVVPAIPEYLGRQIVRHFNDELVCIRA